MVINQIAALGYGPLYNQILTFGYSAAAVSGLTRARLFDASQRVMIADRTQHSRHEDRSQRAKLEVRD